MSNEEFNDYCQSVGGIFVGSASRATRQEQSNIEDKGLSMLKGELKLYSAMDTKNIAYFIAPNQLAADLMGGAFFCHTKTGYCLHGIIYYKDTDRWQDDYEYNLRVRYNEDGKYRKQRIDIGLRIKQPNPFPLSK